MVGIENFWKNRASLCLCVAGLLVNGAHWLYVALNSHPQAEPINLHYNIYFGVDLIGAWYLIFLAPLTSTAVYFINIFFSYILYKREKILSYAVLGVTIFLGFIAFFASFLITRQNI